MLVFCTYLKGKSNLPTQKQQKTNIIRQVFNNIYVVLFALKSIQK